MYLLEQVLFVMSRGQLWELPPCWHIQVEYECVHIKTNTIRGANTKIYSPYCIWKEYFLPTVYKTRQCIHDSKAIPVSCLQDQVFTSVSHLAFKLQTSPPKPVAYPLVLDQANTGQTNTSVNDTFRKRSEALF